MSDLARQSVAAIAEVVARYYAVSAADIRGHGRQRNVVRARHVYWALLRYRLGLSLTLIAWPDQHHHTTVMHALRKPVRAAEWRLFNQLLDEQGEPRPGLVEAAE